jgi:Zn-finger nucleic acid-binding protein
LKEFFVDCPRCKNALVEAKYEGYPVLRCPACNGFWVNGTVLHGLIEKREEVIPQSAIEIAKKWHSSVFPKTRMEDELFCPNCGKKMCRHNYGYDSGVIVDSCEACCGVWLDESELIDLQAFDQVWDDKARELFKEKGLVRLFDEEKNEDPETPVIRKYMLGNSVLGRLADMFVDFLDRE